MIRFFQKNTHKLAVTGTKAAVLLLAPLLVACNKQPTIDHDEPTQTDVLAQLDQRVLLVSEFSTFIKQSGRAAKATSEEDLRGSLDTMIDGLLLSELADAQGVSARSDFMEQAERIKYRAQRELSELARRQLMEQLKADVKVEEGALKSFYEEQKHKYLGRQVKLTKYQFSNGVDAQQWHQRFAASPAAGKDEITRLLSTDLYEKSELGWLSRTSSTPELRKVLLGINSQNAVSQIFTTNEETYFYIFAGGKNNTPRAYAEVRSQLYAQLHKQITEQKLSQLMQQQREQVKINSAALKALTKEIVDLTPPRQVRVRVPVREGEEVATPSGH